MAMTTWRKAITTALNENQETWNDVEACTLTQVELDIAFDDGYGGSSGEPFTMWTHNHVYFPIVYDGAEWAGSVARHPNGKSTPHQGGQ